MVQFNCKNASNFVRPHEIENMKAQFSGALRTLLEGSGAGNDFLGWIDLPVNYDKEEFARIKASAKKIREDSDVLVVVGIGGSYLGARAVIELLSHSFANALSSEKRGGPLVIFAGCNISSSYLADLFDVIGDKEVSVNVISKSGTTTEPAIAFRILRNYMEKRYGHEEAVKRIYCTTDKARGALKTLAGQEGYESFVVPDDIGGRYSVLTAVGLLPIAVAGIDIDGLMQGAAEARELYRSDDLEKNDAARYAIIRNCLLRKGYNTEILVNYEPSFHYMTEWWKQLYGESEGKDGRGIFPAGVDFSTDLHSMGQYIQDGRRSLFETVINIQKSRRPMEIPNDPANLDGLNFLSGKDMSEVNDNAMKGTILAHVDGGVPNLMVSVPEMNEKELGALIYFFEIACGISGYMNAINPFDQPGVEAYKRNMYALLGKPGFEAEGEALRARLDAE